LPYPSTAANLETVRRLVPLRNASDGRMAVRNNNELQLSEPLDVLDGDRD
jgi:hypothetical protein